MVSPADIPRADAPIAANGGFATRAWVDFFLKLASTESQSDLAALYAALAARVAELEESQGFTFQIIGQGAISVNGTPQPGGFVVISLQNDTDNPGNTMYYGTGPTGVKGWFPVSGTMLVEAGQLTKTVASNGVTTFGLADLANSGAGTLRAYTRDAKGRISGDKAATITGTTNQISVANGDASAGLPTLSLAAAVLTSLGKADSALQPGADHNTQLSGLQGGSAGQYYHLTAAQNTSAAAISTSGFIEGLQPIWNSGNSLTFTQGNAGIQSIGSIFSSPSSITKAGLSLSASTWYHSYFFSNSGTPDVEVVTTAPTSTYSGTARSKTGDPSRRYIASIKTDASGNFIQFIMESTGAFRYLIGNNIAPLRVLANGTTTVRTTVSCSSVIPITAMGGIFLMTNTDTSVYANISISTAVSASVVGISPGGALATQILTFPTDSNQAIDYYYSTPPTNGLYVDVVGFTVER